MKWPQIVFLMIDAMGLGVALVKHGERREGTYSFWSSMIATGIQLWILKAGGFFG